jgi:hypothetical protein
LLRLGIGARCRPRRIGCGVGRRLCAEFGDVAFRGALGVVEMRRWGDRVGGAVLRPGAQEQQRRKADSDGGHDCEGGRHEGAAQADLNYSHEYPHVPWMNVV